MAEFLLTVPLKTSYEVNLSDALKTIFKENGYTKDSISNGIEEFQKQRNLIISKNLQKNHASLELMYRYHDQLYALIRRLPNLSHKPLSNVTIYWDDALDKGGLFGGKSNIANGSIELERLCILFNIAALQSFLALDCRAADTDEEFKNSTKLYQSAATIFHFLAECNSPVFEGVTLTQDMKPDTLAALSALMLAQAQEVFVDKAIKDRMKDTIVAKLCAQTEDLFIEASTLLNKDTVKHVWERTCLANVAAKKLGYEALGHYFQSKVCATKKEYGLQIARLDCFIRLTKKAQEKIGSTNYLSLFLTEGERLHREAKRDNDFIYHETVPSEETLDPIERVGSAKLAKLGVVPEMFSSSFSDVFESAVRKGGGDGSDAPTLKSIINTATNSLGHYLINLSSKEKK